MNSHYWYFIVDKDMNLVTVEKKKGLLFESYEYLRDCPTKIKRIIKRMLHDAPAGNRYSFVYKDNEHTLSCVSCVKVESIENVNGSEIWKAMPASDFFSFSKYYEIPRPDTYKGIMVFKTLQQNLDDGLIRYDSKVHTDFYHVVLDDVYVYPLKAL